MSIGKRISEALKKLDEKDFEGALIPICIAIAATSTKENPNINGDGKKYKTMLRDNVDVITFAGFGIILKEGIGFELSNGSKTWDELLYHIVRCNLLHEAKLGEQVYFEEGNAFGLLDDKILMPAELLYGMVFAVIGSCSNSNEHLEEKRTIAFGEINIDLDMLWGDKVKIMDLLEKSGPKQQ